MEKNFIKSNKQKKKTKSFSLVELMVVIAIIGILSAIAVPSYKTYIIRSKIASAIPILENAVNTLIQYYETNGSFPSTLSVYGVNITPGGFATLNIPPITQIYYSNYVHTYISAHVCIYFADIGIPGYVASPLGSNGGTYAKICMTSYLNNDIHTKYCGAWSNGPNDIPVQYLPTGCNCLYTHSGAVGSTNCNS